MNPPPPNAPQPPRSAKRIDHFESATDSTIKTEQIDFVFLGSAPQQQSQPVEQKPLDCGNRKRKSKTRRRRPGRKPRKQPIEGSSAEAQAEWKRRKKWDEAGLCRVEAYVHKTTRECAQSHAAARGLTLKEVIAEALTEKFKK